MLVQLLLALLGPLESVCSGFVRYRNLEDRAKLMRNVMELMEMTQRHAMNFASFDVRAVYQAVATGAPAPTLPVTLCTLLKLCLKIYHALIQVRSLSACVFSFWFTLGPRPLKRSSSH